VRDSVAASAGDEDGEAREPQTALGKAAQAAAAGAKERAGALSETAREFRAGVEGEEPAPAPGLEAADGPAAGEPDRPA
jgi:hypothetical protein